MPIDVVMTSFNRLAFTQQVIEMLSARTKVPCRLIVVDNASRDGTVEYLTSCGLVDTLVVFAENRGIHAAKNAGLALVRSEPYYVDTDNDCLPPDLKPCWLSRLVDLMERHAGFGAVACRPQVMVGEPSGGFDDCGEIRTMRHVGGWLRVMRTKAVRDAGGWRADAPPGRNNEDRWIAARLEEKGLKVGVARDVRCRHLFGENWGYPAWVQHGHAPVWPPPERWDRMELDPDTWEPL